MNEAETRAELIDPALKAAGWGDVAKSRVRREVIAPGRLLGSGQREKSKQCDYVLVYRNHKLAALEAKKRDAYPTEGLGTSQRLRRTIKNALCPLHQWRQDLSSRYDNRERRVYRPLSYS